MDARCLFCGGTVSDPTHVLHCDGRQGRREAYELPISGLIAATYATSAAAATCIAPDAATLREQVYSAILRVGPGGITDDELQHELDLTGNTERPRRWELWKAGRIRPALDPTGAVVKRTTASGRRAVAWAATVVMEQAS